MQNRITNLRAILDRLSEAFEIENLKAEVSKLDAEMAQSNFWNDPKTAAKVQKRRSECSEIIALLERLSAELADVEDFAPMAEQGDVEIEKELTIKLKDVERRLGELEFRRMLGGELDDHSAIVAINSGAGGTESQDWAQILLRMYLRWAERMGFKATIVDSLPGEEAGFKNVTFTVDGAFAYGYIRAESGIHRLVRISPFDANKRRHTSFASVMVLPQVEENIEVELEDADIRVDTFRASGAGGQHVNKTDSAVRLTHLPTHIVVVCQNERSQHKNKAQAMKILRARIFEKQREEKEAEKAKLAGEKKEIGFGSQIRSYVMQPYQMVKDHRTNFEMGNVQGVLDGDLEGFIRSYLLRNTGSS